MTQERRKLDTVLFALIFVLIIAYLCGIFSVNFGGRFAHDYDVYSDAMVAKFIGSEGTLFPEKWHFGNQIYVVATPALAGLLYPVMGDAYSALAMASCLMTLLTLGSFFWCVKPFFSKSSVLIGLLVLVGGANIGLSAHADLEGLQLVYTLASYYACYIIGIFLTLGVYNRLFAHQACNKVILLVVMALNFALGMQSLREMLVLNLPLLAVCVLHSVLSGIVKKESLCSHRKAFVFAIVALLANLCGIVFSKVLAANGVYTQADILQKPQAQLWSNIVLAGSAFKEFIGLIPPYSSFSAFRFVVSALSVGLVAAALLLSVVEYFKKTRIVPVLNNLFFAVSLAAVFFAGLLVLEVRSVYYFCWYPLLSFSIMYLLDSKKSPAVLKKLLVIALIVISLVNYGFLFVGSYKDISASKGFYEEVAERLQEDGIRYIYGDAWSEMSVVATASRDEITYSILSFSGNPDDLWDRLPYLYSEEWFKPENYKDAYIILTHETLGALMNYYSEEYSSVFMENLELVHEISANNKTAYLYKGTEKMFQDMSN